MGPRHQRRARRSRRRRAPRRPAQIRRSRRLRPRRRRQHRRPRRDRRRGQVLSLSSFAAEWRRMARQFCGQIPAAQQRGTGQLSPAQLCLSAFSWIFSPARSMSSPAPCIVWHPEKASAPNIRERAATNAAREWFLKKDFMDLGVPHTDQRPRKTVPVYLRPEWATQSASGAKDPDPLKS